MCHVCSEPAGSKRHIKDLLRAPLPFKQKKNAVVYISNNCHTLSGRQDIVQAIMALNDADVPVHAWGACDNNINASIHRNKVHLMSGYKFCIAMESALSKVGVKATCKAGQCPCMGHVTTQLF